MSGDVYEHTVWKNSKRRTNGLSDKGMDEADDCDLTQAMVPQNPESKISISEKPRDEKKPDANDWTRVSKGCSAAHPCPLPRFSARPARKRSLPELCINAARFTIASITQIFCKMMHFAG